mgnify:CR=1 FL=1
MLCSSVIASSQNLTVNVKQNTDGWKLYVGGEPFMVNGMNWDYFPIGTNYSYSLWEQSPEFIKKALDDEMSLLKYMNVNIAIQHKYEHLASVLLEFNKIDPYEDDSRGISPYEFAMKWKLNDLVEFIEAKCKKQDDNSKSKDILIILSLTKVLKKKLNIG